MPSASTTVASRGGAEVVVGYHCAVGVGKRVSRTRRAEVGGEKRRGGEAKGKPRWLELSRLSGKPAAARPSVTSFQTVSLRVSAGRVLASSRMLTDRAADGGGGGEGGRRDTPSLRPVHPRPGPSSKPTRPRRAASIYDPATHTPRPRPGPAPDPSAPLPAAGRRAPITYSPADRRPPAGLGEPRRRTGVPQASAAPLVAREPRPGNQRARARPARAPNGSGDCSRAQRGGVAPKG